MKIKNYYPCQVCGLEFESEHELIINRGISPLCSNRCVFRLYYKILSAYSKEELLYLAELLKIPLSLSLTQENLAFLVTKKYPKETLSNINKQAQGSCSNNQAHEPEHNLGSCSGFLYNKNLSLNAEPFFMRWLK